MAKIAGYVKEIKVDVGDRMREGQLLAILEVPEMADDLARAKGVGRGQRGRGGARSGESGRDLRSFRTNA